MSHLLLYLQVWDMIIIMKNIKHMRKPISVF